MLQFMIFMIASFVNYKIMKCIFGLFTQGHFFWALAGVITWAWVLFGLPG